MKKPTQAEHEIGVAIGLYFLAQKNEDYVATREFLEKLHITNIQDGPSITIHTARPGLLIGQHGKHIEGLQYKLGKKILIVESFCWADYMTPIDWVAEMEMEQEDQSYWMPE